MNGGDYRTEHRQVDFDASGFLEKVLEQSGKQKEKYALYKLLSEQSANEVEIHKVYAQIHAEFAKQVPAILEKLLAEVDRSYRIRRWRLWKWPELKKEVIRETTRMTNEVLQSMSPLGNQVVQALLLNRAQISRMLSGTMIDLMLGENPAPNLEGIKHFIAGAM